MMGDLRPKMQHFGDAVSYFPSLIAEHCAAHGVGDAGFQVPLRPVAEIGAGLDDLGLELGGERPPRPRSLLSHALHDAGHPPGDHRSLILDVRQNGASPQRRGPGIERCHSRSDGGHSPCEQPRSPGHAGDRDYGVAVCIRKDMKHPDRGTRVRSVSCPHAAQ